MLWVKNGWRRGGFKLPWGFFRLEWFQLMAEAATTGSEMGSEEEVGVSHSGGDGRRRWLHIWGLSCVGGLVLGFGAYSSSGNVAGRVSSMVVRVVS